MEYTKVLSALSRVKDAITTKLDAIKSDVTNVNNSVTNLPTTLDSKFSALTTKVDGVKTDVAGVGSKVDGAKTEIKNSVSALESSSYGYVPNAIRSVKNENITSSSFVDIVNITGNGRLHAATGSADGTQTTYEWKVTVDGVSTTITDQGSGSSTKPKTFLTDVQFIASVEAARTGLCLLNIHNESVTTSSGTYAPLFVTTYHSKEIKNIRFVTNNLGENCTSPILLLTKGGVPFKKSLRVQCRRVSGSDAVQCCACYSLN